MGLAKKWFGYKNLKGMSEVIAQIAWINQAVETEFESPYTLASGNLSPLYIKGERLLVDPRLRSIVISYADALMDPREYEYVAGGELRGIPFADALGYKTGKTSIMVRKVSKGHGAGGQIVGAEPEELLQRKVLLFEDLITDGGSKKVFVNALREVDAYVNHCLVGIDRQQGGKKTLGEMQIELHSLTDLDTIMRVGLEEEHITKKEFESSELYRETPSEWQRNWKEEHPEWKEGQSED